MKKKNIPEHLKRVLAGDDLTDKEKRGMTKRLPSDLKAGIVKVMKENMPKIVERARQQADNYEKQVKTVSDLIEEKEEYLKQKSGIKINKGWFWEFISEKYGGMGIDDFMKTPRDEITIELVEYVKSKRLQIDSIYDSIDDNRTFINTNDQSKQKQNLPEDNREKVNNENFSVLEWSVIFYYADETKLLSSDDKIKNRIKEFMNKHKITSSKKNFYNTYAEARKRINNKKDFPIKKLENVIAFLTENYQQAGGKIENDITFLREEKNSDADY